MNRPYRFTFELKSFLIAIAMTLFILLLLLGAESYQVKNEALLKAKSVMNTQEEIFTQKLQMVAKDLRYLAKNQLLQSHLQTNDPKTKAILATELAQFSRIKGLYDQIRFLDTKGNERIRINFSGPDQEAKIVPDNQLQNKHDRYYFQESINLDAREMYLSKLDLNVENGRVEEPFKPMLRFAKIVTDASGNTAGLMILNYLAADMLEPVRAGIIENIGSFSVLNSQGYWLISPERKDEWGFMFEDGAERTFALQYPSAWKQMQTRDKDELLGESGTFFYDTFLPLNRVQHAFAVPQAPSALLERLFQSEENRWYFVYQLDHRQLLAAMGTRLGSEWYLYLLMALVLSGGIYMLLLIRHRSVERIRNNKIISEVYGSSNEGILITDENATILRVNKAFTQITGYSEEEIIGANPAKIASGWTEKQLYDEMWRSLELHGYWEGEVWDRRKNGSLYSEWLRITAIKDDRGQVRNYVGVFADITEKKESQKRIQQLAYYDMLTNLPNRNLLFDRLRHALDTSRAEKKQTAIMLIDLDNFKYVNDTLGHLSGDKLLMSVASRIQNVLPPRDTVARLGGDEFVVLVEGFGHIEKLIRIAQDIVEKVGEPHIILGEQVYVGASIGVAIFPDDAEDENLLIQYADTAMYKVKESGKSSYRFYTQDMNDSVTERVRIETHLRTAIKEGTFELHFQPQIDSKTHQAIGAEALLRWEHDEMGIIPPSKFVPIAEDAGLIIPLSEWVITRGFEHIVQLEKLGHKVKIALNISPIHLMHDTFIQFVENRLRHTGCNPNLVEFELTETSLAEDREKTYNTIIRLKEMGITIAVDDFGTGYSSLSYLKLFPIDKLKIDRAFVIGLPEDKSDVNLTNAIISIAESFSMNILAEGVENKEQLDFLQEKACNIIQGYYYSKPLPFEEFVNYIRLSQA